MSEEMIAYATNEDISVFTEIIGELIGRGHYFIDKDEKKLENFEVPTFEEIKGKLDNGLASCTFLIRINNEKVAGNKNITAIITITRTGGVGISLSRLTDVGGRQKDVVASFTPDCAEDAICICESIVGLDAI